jgi:hypothetical protein
VSRTAGSGLETKLFCNLGIFEQALGGFAAWSEESVCGLVGEVEAVERGGDGADDLFRLWPRREVAEVGRGELQTVEDPGGALGFEGSDGECIDDDGDSELNGLSVFEGMKLDVVVREETLLGRLAEAVSPVALVETVVEETVVAVLERRGLTLCSVGLQVAAEWNLDLHDIPFGIAGGGPPGRCQKANDCNELADFNRLKYCNHEGYQNIDSKRENPRGGGAGAFADFQANTSLANGR